MLGPILDNLLNVSYCALWFHMLVACAVSEMCPPGFTYVSSAARCYKVVYEGHDWYSAGEKCQELHRGSHLAAITSATENTAVKKFLASELSSIYK